MKRYSKLILKFIQLSAVEIVEYRSHFLFTLVGDLINSFIPILFFGIVYSKVSSIMGWGLGEMYLLIATGLFLEAEEWFFYKGNLLYLPDMIKNGELDFRMIRPIDLQFLISFYNFGLIAIGPVIPGLYLAIKGIGMMGLDHTAWRLVIYLTLLILGFVVHYCLILMMVSFSFFTVSLSNISKLDGKLKDLALNPIDIFPKRLKLAFMSFIPLAIFGSVPVMGFRSDSQWIYILLSTIIMIIFLTLSRKFFYFALRHYSSASS